ncbi:hypothetical protein Hs30E_15960 [Lactococcus hodotermopsidis]|uniref:Lactococcin 972 family bacteriocin n=1 Tax=Pseudolactococcus hodotermopsidis TaxID=2709157 RepID=A0A6A0BED5_9LACT|nr:hypothetical protein [Lactococcus hodotermopsidis]GFH43045.1 hypothetical protein Hs30E_15960 [Lactococcus hodotermopsidis]
MKKIILSAGIFLALAGGAVTAAATTSHPAPDPIVDTWKYGSDGTTDYSHYYVETNPYGSFAVLYSKNWPNKAVAADQKNYGWAKADAKRAWNDPNGFTAKCAYYAF